MIDQSLQDLLDPRRVPAGIVFRKARFFLRFDFKGFHQNPPNQRVKSLSDYSRNCLIRVNRRPIFKAVTATTDSRLPSRMPLNNSLDSFYYFVYKI